MQLTQVHCQLYCKVKHKNVLHPDNKCSYRKPTKKLIPSSQIAHLKIVFATISYNLQILSHANYIINLHMFSESHVQIHNLRNFLWWSTQRNALLLFCIRESTRNIDVMATWCGLIPSASVHGPAQYCACSLRFVQGSLTAIDRGGMKSPNYCFTLFC
jgi:hypothetical protein